MPRFVIQKHAPPLRLPPRGGGRLRIVGGPEGPLDALAEGHASFWLEGRKLRGGWSLRRMKARAGQPKESWLLVKKRDEEADARRNPVSTRPESVVSGKTIEQVGSQA